MAECVGRSVRRCTDPGSVRNCGHGAVGVAMRWFREEAQ